MTPAVLAEAAASAFARARWRVGGRDVDGLLAGRRVRLRFAGDFFEQQLLRALALMPFDTADPLSVRSSGGPPALTLHAWDAASTGVRLETDSWAGTNLAPSGVVEELTDARYQVNLELHGAMVSLLDRQTGDAYHYVPDPRFLPAWETTHPARIMLAGWARAQGLLVCHAAAVASDRGGVLLCGGSGAGKSTTALGALAAGMRSAGDDYVLVEPGRPPLAHALYTSTLLELGHYQRHSALMPVLDHVADQLDRHKAVMFADGGERPALSSGLPLVALVALRVEPGAEPAYEPTSSMAVLRALAPSTLAQLGMIDEAGLRRLAALCRQLPGYALRLGEDPTPVPALLQALIAEAAPTSAGLAVEA